MSVKLFSAAGAVLAILSQQCGCEQCSSKEMARYEMPTLEACEAAAKRFRDQWIENNKYSRPPTTLCVPRAAKE